VHRCCLIHLLPIVQYLGRRERIHQIHIGNIRGSLNDFYEVFSRTKGRWTLQTTRESCEARSFRGSICPDHIPGHPDDPGGFQDFAFGYGYIKALVQAVNREVLLIFMQPTPEWSANSYVGRKSGSPNLVHATLRPNNSTDLDAGRP